MSGAAATPPVVLTIGGADSGGCYGVPTDLRTFAALGVHGTSALTIVTAQNTLGLRSAHPVPVEVIAAQLDAVLEDFDVAAVKTGMLGRAEVIDLVIRYAAAGRLPNLVVDPVVVDRHGRPLFDGEVIDRYRRGLFPHAALVTPNTAELAVLAGPGADRDDALAALAGGRPVVVTAGRLDGAEATDVLWEQGAVHRMVAGRIDTANNAGSGDAFSAAVAAQLALGAGLLHAVHTAKAFVHRALAGATSWRLGQGPGPLDLRAEPGAAR